MTSLTDNEKRGLDEAWRRSPGKAWEPKDPTVPAAKARIAAWVDAGFVRWVDGRCGFEVIPQSMLAWTQAGRAYYEATTASTKPAGPNFAQLARDAELIDATPRADDEEGEAAERWRRSAELTREKLTERMNDLTQARGIERTLREALTEVVGCFDAAYAEGLAERMSDLEDRDTGSIHDLLTRRILYAHEAARQALGEGGPTVVSAEGRVSVTGSFTAYFTDEAVLTKLFAAAEESLLAQVANLVRKESIRLGDLANTVEGAREIGEKVMALVSAQIQAVEG